MPPSLVIPSSNTHDCSPCRSGWLVSYCEELIKDNGVKAVSELLHLSLAVPSCWKASASIPTPPFAQPSFMNHSVIELVSTYCSLWAIFSLSSPANLSLVCFIVPVSHVQSQVSWVGGLWFPSMLIMLTAAEKHSLQFLIIFSPLKASARPRFFLRTLHTVL